MKKIIIFLPCSRTKFHPLFTRSYLNALSYLKETTNYEITDDLVDFTPNLAALRSYCAARMIDGYDKFKPDTSIWLDTDHEFPPDTLYKLLKHEFPIVSGLYVWKKPPNYPVLLNKNKKAYEPVFEFDQVDPFEVDVTGMGCVKIDKEVFFNLKPPYFKYKKHSPFEKGFKDTEFLVKHKIEDVSEDIHFWEQVRGNEFKIMVDPKISIGHIGEIVYRIEHFYYNKTLHKLGDMADEE